MEIRCYEKNEKNPRTLLREFLSFYESRIPDKQIIKRAEGFFPYHSKLTQFAEYLKKTLLVKQKQYDENKKIDSAIQNLQKT